jgi:DNA-binding MarR family transcriptional regulator
MSYGRRVPTINTTRAVDGTSVEVARTARSEPALAGVLRISTMRLARRLRFERDPENDLTLSQLAVLGTLSRHGAMTIGELAAHEKVRPPSMTRLVSCLNERELVSRRAHPTDGRQVVIHLADDGARILSADRLRRDAWMSRRLRELSPAERDILSRAAPIMERLAQS